MPRIFEAAVVRSWLVAMLSLIATSLPLSGEAAREREKEGCQSALHYYYYYCYE